MSERDELARKLDEWLDDEAPLNLRRYVPVADAVLAAGYRRPRTVTTVEELDALPVDSVLKDRVGDIYERVENTESDRALYRVPGIRGFLVSASILFPATVLHEGAVS